jgi:diacylglycerol kinase (ATP)
MRQRFGFAWAGIGAAWRNERSFRIQTVFAIALPVALLLLRVSAVWWALCVIIDLLVLAAELFNTALESLIGEPILNQFIAVLLYVQRISIYGPVGLVNV